MYEEILKALQLGYNVEFGLGFSGTISITVCNKITSMSLRLSQDEIKQASFDIIGYTIDKLIKAIQSQ